MESLNMKQKSVIQYLSRHIHIIYVSSRRSIICEIILVLLCQVGNKTLTEPLVFIGVVLQSYLCKAVSVRSYHITCKSLLCKCCYSNTVKKKRFPLRFLWDNWMIIEKDCSVDYTEGIGKFKYSILIFDYFVVAKYF